MPGRATREADGQGDSTVSADEGYSAGTPILTDRGEVTIETLAVGDRVTTLSREARPIRRIARQSFAACVVAENPYLLPVLIRAGALADWVPRRDLRHRVQVLRADDGLELPGSP